MWVRSLPQGYVFTAHLAQTLTWVLLLRHPHHPHIQTYHPNLVLLLNWDSWLGLGVWVRAQAPPSLKLVILLLCSEDKSKSPKCWWSSNTFPQSLPSSCDPRRTTKFSHNSQGKNRRAAQLTTAWTTIGYAPKSPSNIHWCVLHQQGQSNLDRALQYGCSHLYSANLGAQTWVLITCANSAVKTYPKSYRG